MSRGKSNIGFEKPTTAGSDKTWRVTFFCPDCTIKHEFRGSHKDMAQLVFEVTRDGVTEVRMQDEALAQLKQINAHDMTPAGRPEPEYFEGISPQARRLSEFFKGPLGEPFKGDEDDGN